MAPLTPLPVPTVRVLSVVCTVGTITTFLFTTPELDHHDRPHALTGVQRGLRSAIQTAKEFRQERSTRIHQTREKKEDVLP